MSKTPVCDFIKKYRENTARFHMPAHKGAGGVFQDDITEIDGADVLYSPQGIIAESEKIASQVFNSQATFFSTEGSSLCVRAAVWLVNAYVKNQGKALKILAFRNVHSSFVSACALCGVEPVWVYGNADDCDENVITCNVKEDLLRETIKVEKPNALYVTSPDYLGYRSDIGLFSKICHEENVLLIVDNAHGSYLKFVDEKSHPLDLGADVSIESAHKTLPCLTGAAYLHIGNNAPDFFAKNANFALNLFASTSPSYLIIASLDGFNLRAETYGEEILKTIVKVDTLKSSLLTNGYALVGNEPLKITVLPKKYGYYGYEIANILRNSGLFVEFYDKDFVTLMFSPCNKEGDFIALEKAFLKIAKKNPIDEIPPKVLKGEKVLSVRDATFAPFSEVDVQDAENKILAGLIVSCPPAVPILVCGERISNDAVKAFKYYGVEKVRIVKN